MSGVYDERPRAARQTDESRRHRDKRSRSPERKQRRRLSDVEPQGKGTREHGSEENPSSQRLRSPHRHHTHRRRRERDSPAVPPATLPFDARPLTKSDLRRFEPLLAHYLDLQKQKYIEDMDDREIRGRWKSFVGKWNRGELAEGWYDPDMFQRIVASHQEEEAENQARDEPPRQNRRDSSAEGHRQGAAHADDQDDSDYGPALPSSSSARASRRVGVTIPSIDDLALRDERRAEDRSAAIADLRAERRAERTLEKERLEELAPRAEPGTRERRLEKKRALGDKMRGFREGSPGGSMAAATDSELMGGGGGRDGDSLAELKQQKAEAQQRKSEREMRREELQRAKQAEMEERRRRYEEREKGTMSMLQELARQRFGAGS
ncbi:RNA helicase HEL117 [Beauveria bassiana ARSEF 2860]|uniref:RNA helicase HEL117 n=1 Tax=Beauveria bassiana (strain ARSEF 2860) TaxID=655819 RepID=J4W558_BEAB2|nr:RNA helicase HEL117 [Beauveria bassiana ARSEF 2860]EJP65510.1 RNA helicase HEL117 [Beauveria bassiana ARSEF 2860]